MTEKLPVHKSILSLPVLVTDDGKKLRYDDSTDTAYYEIDAESHPYAQLFAYTLMRDFARIARVEMIGDAVYSLHSRASQDHEKIIKESQQLQIDKFLFASILRDFDHYTAPQFKEGAANMFRNANGEEFLFDFGAVAGMFKPVTDVQYLLGGLTADMSVDTLNALKSRLDTMLEFLKTSDGQALVQRAIAVTGKEVREIFTTDMNIPATTIWRTIIGRIRSTKIFVQNQIERKEAIERLHLR